MWTVDDLDVLEWKTAKVTSPCRLEEGKGGYVVILLYICPAKQPIGIESLCRSWNAHQLHRILLMTQTKTAQFYFFIRKHYAIIKKEKAVLMSTGIFQKPLFYDQKDQGTFYQSDLWIQRHKQNQNKKQHAVLFPFFAQIKKGNCSLFVFFSFSTTTTKKKNKKTVCSFVLMRKRKYRWIFSFTCGRNALQNKAFPPSK